jgi:outer membrane protein assembly factor BamB
MPSGHGICSDNLYYLPLREGIESKEPEIVAIDLERGAIHAHTKSRKKEIPGNLVFFEGDVVSQSTTEIAVFPQLRVKLAQIDERIKNDPNDPIGLVERGELRLDKGDLQGAVEDLSRALQQPTIPAELVGKAKSKLFETLTDYLQRDFAAAEKYLDTYEGLTRIEIPADATPEVKASLEAETRRRRTAYLCLVAKGREGQRRLLEAFEKYQEFAVYAGSEEHIVSVDEPAVQVAPDVWVQGRIMALMLNATDAERKPLEQKVQQQWEELRKTADVATVRRFVAVFGSYFPAGKEAQLALAEMLIDSKEPDSLLDAERNLLQLMKQKESDPTIAGRAVECMARLLTKRGLLDDAAYYYDILGRHYAEVVVAGGRKGADIFNDLATDKRFLPQLDRVSRVSLAPRWKVTEDRGNNPMQGNVYTFDRDGDPLPYFDRWQLTMNLNQNELQLEDKLAVDERPERIKLATLQVPYLQNIINYQQQMANQQRRYDQPKLTAQGMGHLTILQLGYMVYAIDPVTTRPQRVLWEKNLLTGAGLVAGSAQPRANVPMGGINFGQDPDQTPTVIFQEGFVQRLGTPASLDSGILCLQTRDSLIAVDPLTGRVLWTRGDVRSSARVTCEAGHVFIVEMSPTGTPANTRVLRLADGVTLPQVQDFAALYQKKIRTFGRFLLIQEPGAAGGLVAKLYDPLTAKFVWEQPFQANSIVLQSASPELFGVVEPDGKITISNLKQRKVVLTSKVRMPDFERLISSHLLTDGKDYFVLCNGALEQQIAQFGNQIQPPIMLNQGMRALPVNGMVYSFNGETGKLRWIARAENQQLILDRFDEMPVLLFAARYTRFSRKPPQRALSILALETINKQNGKLLYRNTSDPDDTRSEGYQPLPMNGTTFFAVNLNPAEGKFEFVANNVKVTHKADLEAK